MADPEQRTSGKGACAYCAGRKNDPSEAADAMRAAGVEPLEPYPGGLKPWRCRCLTCGKEVAPAFSSVKQGQGACIYCGGKARHDEADAVAVMRAAGLEPLEPYRNADAAWRCLCRTCEREVAPTFHSVNSGQGGCIYCGGNRVDPSEAVALMRRAGLEPRIPYPGNNTRWPSTCMTCRRDVAPVYARVSRGGRCAYCARRRVDPAEAVAIMRAAGLEPLEDYPGSTSPWPCQCLEGLHQVTPTFGNVRTGHGGCLYCSSHGFQHDQPGIVYVVTHPEWGAHKIGIAGLDTGRLVTHTKVGWQVYKTLYFEEGRGAFLVEQAVLRHLRVDLGYPPFLAFGTGWSETVSDEALTLPEMWQLVTRAAEELAD